MDRILIIEDDRALNRGLRYGFGQEGYVVEAAYTLEEGRALFSASSFDLLILDVNLPDGDGFDFCKWARERREVPVIFLTARDLEEDAVKGYDLGADDYVTKPFSMVLLKKKASAILKRTKGGRKDDTYEDGYLSLDFGRAKAWIQGKEIYFTPTEYKMLRLFIDNRNQVLTHKILLERLWDNNGLFVDKHALAVNVNRLRGKLEDGAHKYIATIYGMGYQWIGDRT